ncbi:MAG TPA: hypothetical protein PKW90_16995, partial [Myxococcota bacterium]|nr:hypothetical protein [Myxococcota bacterium]
MLALLLACTPEPKDSEGGCELLEAVPVDDPAEWTVEEEAVWHPVLSEPEFVIPGDGLPQETQTANNNVAIAI